MKVQRVEQQVISKSHPMWKLIDEYCFRSKNLYNEANYIIRQEFIHNGNWIHAFELDKSMKDLDVYKLLGSQPAQKTIELLDKNWKSFFVVIKDWSKHKEKYLGRPHLPKYLKKDGRFILMLKNIQCRIENGYLIFSWKPFKNFTFKTHAEGKLIQVRFVPNSNNYTMEIVYEIEVPDIQTNSSRVCGIDIGVDNFATVSNNANLPSFIINGRIIKSMNQYYNKRKAEIQSELKKSNKMNWSNRLQQLTTKRNNKIKDYIHKASRYIINWCVLNSIDTIIVGNNDEWKQKSKMSKKTNQQFITIPYEMFINQLVYKGENEGIRVIVNEESYTSGTSFLDNELPIKANYNKSRRIKRGLFRSNSGKLINADLNAAYQIPKKVISNIYSDEYIRMIEGVSLHPVRVNL